MIAAAFVFVGALMVIIGAGELPLTAIGAGVLVLGAILAARDAMGSS